jgi:hypothetical protein
MRKSFFALSATLLAWLLSVALVIAQTNCPELVSQALEAVDANCNATGRNEACYGYDQVEASFLVDVADDFFSQVAAISPVADIETIRTAPLNTETGVWGVAVMNIQADLPNTIPGQSVTFVLLGDVEVENAVAPEDAFVPSEGMEVTVNIPSGANVRSGPGTNFNVVGGLQNGQTVLADGLSEDGQWLRVAYRERPAWLSLSVVVENAALAELPTLTAELQTPMQAFYLRTGIGEPECNEAPESGLLVQGPENIEITINVNGADISLGSSGILRIIYLDGLPFLQIIVIDGQFTTGGKTISAGQQSVLCLGDENSRGLDGEDNDLVVTCDPSDPEPVEDYGEAWCEIESIPENILNYSLEVLCPGETPPPLPSEETAGAVNEDTSEIEGVDCSTFAILTGSVPATSFELSWSEALGADSYEVAVFDGSGNQTSVHSGIVGTSIGLNGGDGFANAGYIDVRAYQAGQYACFVRLGFERAPDPNEPVGGYEGFAVGWHCTEYYGEVEVSWTNGESGVGYTLEIGTNSNLMGSGYSGNYYLYPCGTINGTVTSSTGQSYPLGPVDCGCGE